MGKIAIAGASEELPVVVLLDLNLPRVNALDVLRTLRANEKTKFVPVIILTSSNEERDIISSYGLGANSFVRKPVKFNDFAEAIRLLGLCLLFPDWQFASKLHSFSIDMRQRRSKTKIASQNV